MSGLLRSTTFRLAAALTVVPALAAIAASGSWASPARPGAPVGTAGAFTIVDVGNPDATSTLRSGTVREVAALPRRFRIRLAGSVARGARSVRFCLGARCRVDDRAPFAVPGTHDRAGWTRAGVTLRLTARAHARSGARGQVVGSSRLTFTVPHTDAATPTPAPTPTPTPAPSGPLVPAPAPPGSPPAPAETAAPAPAPWRLVFREDFDGAGLDREAWKVYDGPGHAGNGLRKPSAVQVRDGSLVLTAQMVGGQLVSGGIAQRTDLRHGRFEFRVRTEPDPSGATSGVGLTWPQSERWPVDGEVDIYETLHTTDRSSFHSFVHFGADDRRLGVVHPADPSEWHDMAMEWDAHALRIFRDGVLVWTVTDPEAIPDVAHHLCLQLDAFKPAMGAAVRMYVDRVRVYQPG